MSSSRRPRGNDGSSIRGPTTGKGSSKDMMTTTEAEAEAETETERSDNDDEELRSLLKRLRPFQRQAFDFAVKGRPLGSDDGGGGRGVGYDDAIGGGRGGKAGSKKPSSSSSERANKSGAGTGRIFLGDEMGLGKTITSLAIMCAYRNEWPLLVLCPASLRYTWPSEIEKFCPWLPPESIYVVRGKDDVGFARKKNFGSGDDDGSSDGGRECRRGIRIVVATYSLLQKRFAVSRVLESCKFESVVADESHNLKERSSQRCKLALPLLKSAKRLILLTGTPVLNRPVELWAQLHCLDPKLFGSYSDYTKRYCNARMGRFGWDVKGSSNMEELHDLLKLVMVRRLKSDVLQELPPKQRSVVPMKMDPSKVAECRELMENLAAARKSVDELVGDEANGANFEARQLLNRAYHASGKGKAASVAEYVVDWLEGSDSKLLVFAHHKDVLDTIQSVVLKKFKGMGHIRIDGSVPPAERALAVKKFQTNTKIRLALLSMTAAGVGLTLTAASSIIFAELHWTPGVLAQAEDRCHRIGQANAVNVSYCIVKDEELSVDVALWKMLGRKVGNLGRIMDGRKGVSMDAKEVEEGRTDGGNGGGREGVSGEEELSSFFASTSPHSAKKNGAQGGMPVKGTIQSFFKKQDGVCTPVKKGKANDSTKKLEESPSKELVCWNTSGKTITLLDDEDEKDGVEMTPGKFTCRVCTLDNEGTEFCVMCNTPYDADATLPQNTESHPRKDPSSRAFSHAYSESAEVVVSSRKPGEYDEWSCDACTFMNKEGSASCEMCGSEAKKLRGGESSSAKRTDCSVTANAIPTHDRVTQSPGDSSVDLTGECDEYPRRAPQRRNDVNRSEIVEIFDDDLGTTSARDDLVAAEDANESDRRRPKKKERLSFSVSKNSGRIAVHTSVTGQPLHVNFDIFQVLTDECSDRVQEQVLKRSGVGERDSIGFAAKLSFDVDAIRQVLATIDREKLNCPLSDESCCIEDLCEELKTFISKFMALKEVEKKAVKESGMSITSSALETTVSKLVLSTVGGATERYTGGAKERAMENMQNDCVTEVDTKVLEGGACAWCAETLTCGTDGVIESTYCSHSCAEEGRLRRGGVYASKNIRKQLFAMETGVCRKCKVDAHALFLRISVLRPAERLNAMLNANWRLPQSGRALDRILQKPNEGDFWQADHIVAVAEGGGNCSLDNIRTLCVPCHKDETALLHSRVRLKRSDRHNSSDASGKKGGCQMDILTAFSQTKTIDDHSGNRRRKRRRLAD